MNSEEAMIRACIAGDRTKVATLLSTGTEPNARWQSSTGLMWSAMENHADTGLYLAADNGHAHTVASLIRAGGSVNTSNIGGWTPLMMASARGDLDTITLLLEQGADVTPVNRWGQTALSEAKKSFRARDAIALLTKAGAAE